MNRIFKRDFMDSFHGLVNFQAQKCPPITFHIPFLPFKKSLRFFQYVFSHFYMVFIQSLHHHICSSFWACFEAVYFLLEWEAETAVLAQKARSKVTAWVAAECNLI